MGQPPTDPEWESFEHIKAEGQGDPIEAEQLRSAYNLISVVFCLID